MILGKTVLYSPFVALMIRDTAFEQVYTEYFYEANPIEPVLRPVLHEEKNMSKLDYERHKNLMKTARVGKKRRGTKKEREERKDEGEEETSLMERIEIESIESYRSLRKAE